MHITERKLKLIAGIYNAELSLSIAKILKVPISFAFSHHSKNGRIEVIIGEKIEGEDIFILGSSFTHSGGLNDCIAELIILIDACKQLSATSITASNMVFKSMMTLTKFYSTTIFSIL